MLHEISKMSKDVAKNDIICLDGMLLRIISTPRLIEKYMHILAEYIQGQGYDNQKITLMAELDRRMVVCQSESNF